MSVLSYSMLNWSVVKLGRVTSTQDVAKVLRPSNEDTCLVVVAETQTEGRGRRGTRWHSDKGGLYVTVVLKIKGGTGLLPILAGVATAEAIMDVTGIKAELKWPNDILLRGRKVGGVLAESGWFSGEVRSALLGIGVNVNNPIPEEIPEATSLSSEFYKKIDLECFLKSLIDRLDHHLALMDANPQMIIQSWRALNQTLGNIVEVSNRSDVVTRGLAVDVDEDGALILKTDDGLKRIVSGHVIKRYS